MNFVNGVDLLGLFTAPESGGTLMVVLARQRGSHCWLGLIVENHANTIIKQTRLYCSLKMGDQEI